MHNKAQNCTTFYKYIQLNDLNIEQVKILKKLEDNAFKYCINFVNNFLANFDQWEFQQNIINY